MSTKQKQLTRLTVSAVFLALATATSNLTLWQMPMGGKVTPASMLPLVLLSIGYGPGWGLLCGAVYGGIQLLLGLNNLSYATWWGAAVAIVMLDYLVAYTVIGLSGIFARKTVTVARVVAGVALGCLLRFACHFLTGVTVWRELTGAAAVWYSLGYNGTYMAPELVLTAVLAGLLTALPSVRSLLGKLREKDSFFR